MALPQPRAEGADISAGRNVSFKQVWREGTLGQGLDTLLPAHQPFSFINYGSSHSVLFHVV